MKIADDKMMHFIVSMLAAFFIIIFTDKFALTVLIVITVGLFKEFLWDDLYKKGDPDIRDMVANYLGAIAGGLLGLFV